MLPVYSGGAKHRIKRVRLIPEFVIVAASPSGTKATAISPTSSVSPAAANVASPDQTNQTDSACLLAGTEKVAARLGFVPSPIARGLTTRSTAAWGIVVPGMADPFFMPIARGIEQVAQRLGYAAMLYDTGRSANAVVEAVTAFLNFRVAGVLILGGSERRDLEMAQRLDGIPAVVAIRRSHDGAFPAVYFDHGEGTGLAVDHLVAKGRQRIAFVQGDTESVAGQERHAGYLRGLREHNRPIEPELVARGRFTLEGAAEATAHLIGLPPLARPDAIIYASDMMALVGLRGLRDAGISVPDDVAVIGYGDIEFAALSEPPLTTIRVPKEQIGLLAARILEQMIDTPRVKPADVRVSLELIARGSTTVLGDVLSHARSSDSLPITE